MMEKSSNLRILVTGGNGFLGKVIIRLLQKQGYNYIFAPHSYEYDLTDYKQTKSLFSETKPELVLHLAAKVGGIGANSMQPGTFFRDNILMGVHVLEVAKQTNVKKVVVAGTVCAYPKFTPVPFLEENLWNGYPEETNAPYGIAKKALLVMAQAYRQEFGSNFIVIFPANLYGPEDNFDLQTSHVIPAMIRKFVTAKIQKQTQVELWGDGTPTREFLYVEDAAQGFIKAAQHYNESSALNLGTGLEINMKDLAYKVAKIIKYQGDITWNSDYPNGQPRRSLDITRAKTYLNFEAMTTLDQGLTQTIEWYLKNLCNIQN